MILAHKRWNHSQKKMNLKSARVKSKLSKWNCGVCLYLLNSAIHCCSFSGGNVPVITSHSVIDNPLPVSRVIPPNAICITVIPTPINNQVATSFEERSVVFIIPFSEWHKGTETVLGDMGALQGAVGWIMVASGLTGDAVYVKPTRLALHFIFALGLLCYTFWFALQLLVKREQITYDTRTRKWNWILLGLLVVQLLYGALMAGHKAATVASSWPTINGQWVPGNMFSEQPFLLNFVDNKALIHFIHRGLAYLLLVLIIAWSYRMFKTHGAGLFNLTRWIPVVIAGLQVVLGIAAVLTSTGIVPGKWGIFEWVAQLHQLIGMILLLSLVWMLFIVRKAAPRV